MLFKGFGRSFHTAERRGILIILLSYTAQHWRWSLFCFQLTSLSLLPASFTTHPTTIAKISSFLSSLVFMKTTISHMRRSPFCCVLNIAQGGSSSDHHVAYLQILTVLPLIFFSISSNNVPW